jgi:naphthoate synthase
MTQTYEDIIYSKQDGVATVSINRPWVLNAFRPRTIDEMLDAFHDAWYDDSIGVVVLTGEQGNFSSGGDQKIRGHGGYEDESAPRLQVRNPHRMILEIPKPVIAKVAGCHRRGHVLRHL